MKRKPLIQFLLGLTISGIVSGLVYGKLFFDNFDMFGIAEMRDPESIHAKYFYTGLFMTILTVAVFILLYRKEKRWRLWEQHCQMLSV